MAVAINLRALNSFLDKAVQPYLFKKAEEIANEARQQAPLGATGDLRESITVEKGVRGGVKIQVSAPHAGFVHQGTGPQHRPNPNPPYFPRLRRRGLILWSESKSLNPYNVAAGIAKSGTPANPFLEESIEKVLRRFDFRWIRQDLEVR